MDGQVFKITELNPQMEMEMLDLLREAGLASRWSRGLELFAVFDSQSNLKGVACAREFDDFCLLSLVAVRKEAEGKGTGSALVNHVLGYFSSRCERAFTIVGEGEAKGFFQRFGFVPLSSDELPGAVADFVEAHELAAPESVAMVLNLPHRW
jgi:N-acetylglutamate synthase-like GNAT family acetyltransferase